MKRTAILFFISILLIAGSVSAAPQDPSGGACDELETSSNLFPVCLQAYSAINRVQLLATTNASQKAKDNAQAALDDAIDEYKALLEGGLSPGAHLSVQFFPPSLG